MLRLASFLSLRRSIGAYNEGMNRVVEFKLYLSKSQIVTLEEGDQRSSGFVIARHFLLATPFVASILETTEKSLIRLVLVYSCVYTRVAGPSPDLALLFYQTGITMRGDECVGNSDGIRTDRNGDRQ